MSGVVPPKNIAQVAQKLHAFTDLTYSRAHDLVDLHVLWRRQFDLAELK